jgi:hypothetical protein
MPYQISALQSTSSARFDRAPVTLHLHHPPYRLDPDEINVAWALSPVMYPTDALMKHWFLNDILVVSSKSLFRRVREGHDTRILYESFPVDPEIFSGDCHRMCLINATHNYDCEVIRPRRVVLGTVLRHRNFNGYETAVRAFLDASAKSDNMMFVVGLIGTPEDPDFVEGARQMLAQVAENCRMRANTELYLVVDRFDDKAYAEFIAAMDVIIYSPGWDNLQALPNHALAMNKPIIAPDYGGEEEWTSSPNVHAVPSALQPGYDLLLSDDSQQDIYVCGVREMGVTMRSLAAQCLIHDASNDSDDQPAPENFIRRADDVVKSILMAVNSVAKTKGIDWNAFPSGGEEKNPSSRETSRTAKHAPLDE